MTDSVRAANSGSREPDPSSTGSGPSGFDPGRKLRSMSHEQLVAECCYRGAELVIERQRNALADGRFKKRLLAAWTDFLDANPDDVTSPEEYPDHALVTFDQVLRMVDAAKEAPNGNEA